MNIIFAGTPEFALPCLQVLHDSEHTIVAVYTQPDRPAGRGRKPQASPIKQWSETHHLTVYQPSSLNNEKAQTELAAFKADLMVVVAYGLLLPKAILNLPRLGCINVHASLLPRWRGAAPIERALLANDLETGITLMQMDHGLDTGDILAKAKLAIRSNETAGELSQRLSTLGATVLEENLLAIEKQLLIPTKQDDTLACYAKKITKADQPINWHLPAQQLQNQIRALNPKLGATTQRGEITLKIWQANVEPSSNQAPPGTLLSADKKSIRVATGKGVLNCQCLQWPGGKPLPAVDVINARQHWFTIGALFS